MITLCLWQMGEWKYSGESNVAGVVAAVVALMMWATSMEPVRKQFFNVFLGVHQLYILLFAFYAWHVGKNHAAKAMGGIFLFFVDRFLRLVQSRRQLTSVSAQVLPSGVVELKIPKHAGTLISSAATFSGNYHRRCLNDWLHLLGLPLQSRTRQFCRQSVKATYPPLNFAFGS